MEEHIACVTHFASIRPGSGIIFKSVPNTDSADLVDSKRFLVLLEDGTVREVAKGLQGWYKLPDPLSFHTLPMTCLVQIESADWNRKSSPVGPAM